MFQDVPRYERGDVDVEQWARCLVYAAQLYTVLREQLFIMLLTLWGWGKEMNATYAV